MKIHSAIQLFHKDRQGRRRRRSRWMEGRKKKEKKKKKGRKEGRKKEINKESRCTSATSNCKYTKNHAGHIKNHSRASTGHRQSKLPYDGDISRSYSQPPSEVHSCETYCICHSINIFISYFTTGHDMSNAGIHTWNKKCEDVLD